MAFVDQWTLSALRTSCRQVLADPAGRFWSDAELNDYINQWQSALQHHFEFTWGTATYTSYLSTYTISSVTPAMLRLDRVFWNEYRLSGRSKQNLDDTLREWRTSITGGLNPKAVYQNDSLTFSLWPPPSTSGTLILEYPVVTTFNHDTDVMSIPSWTRYSCKDYVAWKCYLREGPANSPTKAARYKQRWERAERRIRTMYDNYFPAKAPRIKPAGSYEYDILLIRNSADGVRDLIMAQFFDETPSGTIDGVNATFTLSVTPSELLLTVNGLTMTEGIDYTLSGFTITFLSGAIPQIGDIVTAYIYRG